MRTVVAHLGIVACALFIYLAIAPGCNSAEKNPVRVACSANAVEAIRTIAEQFTDQTHIPVQIIPGSSGNLTAQITQGAPFDVFVSANTAYPIEIVSRGLAASEVRVYAYGTLVVRHNPRYQINRLPDLVSDTIQKIAIANPKFAPYGIAAHDALLRSQLIPSLDKKLVYGESVTQVNQFVETGAVDVAFTAKSSVVHNDNISPREWFEVDPDLYSPIKQGAVLLSTVTPENSSGQQFFEFLFSDDARETLTGYGYHLPPK